MRLFKTPGAQLTDYLGQKKDDKKQVALPKEKPKKKATPKKETK